MLIGIGAVQSAADKAALVAFQNRGGGLPMYPHGHPDPATLINMGKYKPLDHWPESQVAYLAGGEKPGTFLRDVSGVFNQVPRWAWFTLGGLSLVLSGLAYRRHRKDKKSSKKKRK
jgi:hypothetical protein